MKDFWNERYEGDFYAYGMLPNEFVKKELDILSKGSVLFAAEGEGRNAVYAAKTGWSVEAFDYSKAAKNKAVKLAASLGLQFEYKVLDVLDFQSNESFDVIVLCYAHFPISIREKAIQHLLNFLKPNGVVIFEAFSKNQLGKTSGGPKNKEMLFSISEVLNEFKGLNFTQLEETNIELKEGSFHQGIASVIRFVGRKIVS
ncbi:class I SAM-dependent methyltransferase [Aurantibacter sp.]|uniref:class I SAM-dependent methyltransferase n=1 Tax=Aurantibacter sp. TaxID=2807103 RepID=UPI0032650448